MRAWLTKPLTNIASKRNKHTKSVYWKLYLDFITLEMFGGITIIEVLFFCDYLLYASNRCWI